MLLLACLLACLGPQRVECGPCTQDPQCGPGLVCDLDAHECRQPADVGAPGVCETTTTTPTAPATTDTASEPGTGCRSDCCRVCDVGKACGDTCIDDSETCEEGRGCACNRAEVCCPWAGSWEMTEWWCGTFAYADISGGALTLDDDLGGCSGTLRIDIEQTCELTETWWVGEPFGDLGNVTATSAAMAGTCGAAEVVTETWQQEVTFTESGGTLTVINPGPNVMPPCVLDVELVFTPK